jgi:hypothetical protein
MRRALLITGAILASASPAVADAPGLTVVPNGGAGGGPALYLPGGDLLNVRNIQGGVSGGAVDDLNLDLGAGSTAEPGDIVLNYDVGRRVLIYDGNKNLIAEFGSKIIFHRPVTVMDAAGVRTARPHGGQSLSRKRPGVPSRKRAATAK